MRSGCIFAVAAYAAPTGRRAVFAHVWSRAVHPALRGSRAL